MQSKKVLVLWSGGVESTSLIKKFLTDTDHQVFAHFIRLVNPEQRLANEASAVKTLYPLLSAIRPFSLTLSDLSICSGEALPNDSKTAAFIGVSAMYQMNCNELHKGYCKEDQYIRTFVNGVSTILPRQSHDPLYYHKKNQELIKMLLRTEDQHKEVHPYIPHNDLTKKEHMIYLGGLLEHTWSCRRPVNNMICGRCHSCIERS